MRIRRKKPPFAERGGRVRGLFDLVTVRYPAFVFGGRVGEILPVFHFHEVTPESLRSCLEYLVDNGYQTVTSDEIARFVRTGIPPGKRTVALCFDDAYASLWTVALPLLKKYDLGQLPMSFLEG